LIVINGLKFLQDREYYTKNGAHLWLKDDGDFINIGMDAFAAMMTGYISFITVDKKTAKSGESIGSFESAKYISKLYSPVSGKIVEVNNDALKDPSKINKDPYLTWIFKIKPEDMNYKSKYIIKNKDQISNWIKDEIKKFELR
jgi:glycine cleavage system H protein